jgi:hypothetical protein
MAWLPRSWRASWGAAALAVLFDVGCHADACERGVNCPDRGPATSMTGDAAVSLVQADAACVMQSVHAMRGAAKPVDIVFVIDNSGSMNDEIAQVRASLNQDFAAIIAASGVDFRVIMISQFGADGTGVCIEPPLGGAACSSGLETTNGPAYFHYNQEIGSTDGLCQVLATFAIPDQSGRAPQGWQAWLRPEAAKAFVMITDDSAGCEYREGATLVQLGGFGADPYEDALAFHRALLAKSGEQFGVPPDVKYQFFSLVGMTPNDPPSEPYFPHDGLRSETCDTAPTPGLMYQALSIATDALRYPVCEGRSFDAVFRVLARSVIQASKADCVFELPKPPAEHTLELSTVNLEYRPGDGSAGQHFGQVASPAVCKDDHSFYIRDRIELCPAACRAVQLDPMPEVEVLYGCMIVPQ